MEVRTRELNGVPKLAITVITPTINPGWLIEYEAGTGNQLQIGTDQGTGAFAIDPPIFLEFGRLFVGASFERSGERNLRITRTITGIESVTVPAGTFETYREEIVQSSDEGTSKTTQWVSAELGIAVKSIYVSNGLTPDLRPQKTTSINELLGTNIAAN